MMKSTLMRWGVCALAVLAMIALLGGCAKKEKAETTEGMETTETGTADEAAAPAMAGSYMASMGGGTATLMLNADMTASFSLQPTETAPAQVENGTWVAGAMANTADVTFSKTVNDSTMSVTLNFAASGDSLRLTNGETVGMPGLLLMKQP